MPGPYRSAVLALVLLAAAGLAAAGTATVWAQRAEPSRSQAAQPIQLVPHRAVYEFSLGNVRSGKGITALSGRMVYEFTGSACEGYTQSMRFVTRSSSESGAISV